MHQYLLALHHHAASACAGGSGCSDAQACQVCSQAKEPTMLWCGLCSQDCRMAGVHGGTLVPGAAGRLVLPSLCGDSQGSPQLYSYYGLLACMG